MGAVPARKVQAGVVHDVYANNHIEPPWSHVWAGAIFLGFALIVVGGLRGVARARRKARQAEDADIAEAPQRPGEAVFKGVARPALGDDGARPLIRVEIAQEGTERKVGKEWEHSWQEVSRSVDAAPFCLELPNGARLRVEPGDTPFLVDALEKGTRQQRDRRTMVAELKAGEAVIVAGKLERGFDPAGGGDAAGYRGVPTGWVIRPERGRLFLSTEPLERRHHQRARMLARRTAGAAVLMLLTAGFFSPYLARLLWGTTLEAKIAKLHMLREVKKRRGGGWTHRYGLVYRVEGALPSAGRKTGWVDLDDEDHRRLKDGERMFLRFLPGRLAFATTGGAGSSTHIAAIFGGVLALMFALVLDPPRPWYDRPLVQAGKGRL